MALENFKKADKFLKENGLPPKDFDFENNNPLRKNSANGLNNENDQSI